MEQKIANIKLWFLCTNRLGIPSHNSPIKQKPLKLLQSRCSFKLKSQNPHKETGTECFCHQGMRESVALLGDVQSMIVYTSMKLKIIAHKIISSRVEWAWVSYLFHFVYVSTIAQHTETSGAFQSLSNM